MLDQGKEAYLTTKLEKRLKSFLKFMQDSIELADEQNYQYPDWREYDEALVLIHTRFSTKN